MKKILLVLVMALATVSCTENIRARNWGGTSTVELEKGKTLVNATWKNTDLWLLTKDRPDGQEPSTYEFSEDSSFGVMEGKIIIKEQ
jgi:hypothetical protein